MLAGINGNDRATLDDKVEGVKQAAKGKNANSVDEYHILSNLTAEQEAKKHTYNGQREADTKKTTNQEGLQLSERFKRKKSL